LAEFYNLYIWGHKNYSEEKRKFSLCSLRDLVDRPLRNTAFFLSRRNESLAKNALKN
jgi:hypothetical protein